MPYPNPDKAACRGSNPELFFPNQMDDGSAEPARAFCRRCEVARDCLVYALENQLEGIWGGSTAGQRRKTRTQMNKETRSVGEPTEDTEEKNEQ